MTLVAGDPIRSIAYDPASLHMAAVTCNGTLHVWEIATRTSLSAIEDACPEVLLLSCSLWHDVLCLRPASVWRGVRTPLPASTSKQ